MAFWRMCTHAIWSNGLAAADDPYQFCKANTRYHRPSPLRARRGDLVGKITSPSALEALGTGNRFWGLEHLTLGTSWIAFLFNPHSSSTE